MFRDRGSASTLHINYCVSVQSVTELSAIQNGDSEEHHYFIIRGMQIPDTFLVETRVVQERLPGTTNSTDKKISTRDLYHYTVRIYVDNSRGIVDGVGVSRSSAN